MDCWKFTPFFFFLLLAFDVPKTHEIHSGVRSSALGPCKRGRSTARRAWSSNTPWNARKHLVLVGAKVRLFVYFYSWLSQNTSYLSGDSKWHIGKWMHPSLPSSTVNGPLISICRFATSWVVQSHSPFVAMRMMVACALEQRHRWQHSCLSLWAYAPAICIFVMQVRAIYIIIIQVYFYHTYLFEHLVCDVYICIACICYVYCRLFLLFLPWQSKGGPTHCIQDSLNATNCMEKHCRLKTSTRRSTLNTFLTQWERLPLFGKETDDLGLQLTPKICGVSYTASLRKAWTKLPRTVWFPCPFLAKIDASPKEALENRGFFNGLTDGTELCRFSVCEDYDSPICVHCTSKIHQSWTPLDPHFWQLRFRITSLSWFSSSDVPRLANRWPMVIARVSPNLRSKNILFEDIWGL